MEDEEKAKEGKMRIQYGSKPGDRLLRYTQYSMIFRDTRDISEVNAMDWKLYLEEFAFRHRN